ncbi:MAG: universal stress protein [Acidobacteriota bacterium]|nr:universal stress protein [Acidobacteriota bacterium]
MKILFATDGSEYSIEAARKLSRLIAINKNTTIKVFNVVEPIAPAAPFGVSDEYYVQARDALKRSGIAAVDETADALCESEAIDTTAVERQSFVGRPKEAIVSEAETWHADLIVVGSHGRGFWGRMLLGSVSSAVVKHANCSVLVVRKSGEEE